ECSAYYFVAQPKRIKDLMNFLENFKSNEKDCVSATDDNSCAYVHFHDSLPIDGEYQSLSEYAELLVRSIYDELGISVRVGVGEKVKSFEEIAVSYAQAVTANRMRAIFNENASVATYKEYVLIKLLEEVPKYKLQELLDILLEPDAKSLLSDEDMVKTAEEFLGTNLNVSETSRNLFMHRNTLMYRLDKIARTTGLDVRKFQDAATFRIVLILNRILNNKV
ncbi:MAG: helix-turn-helix domain-containing protein, partial [Clostridia bacterium]|nr:helix-turn-helix domain-containing protein [Clostridia bacterium]